LGPRAKNIAVVRELNEGHRFLRDEAFLHQCFSFFLDNADKVFAERNADRVVSQQQGGTISSALEDQGIGVPPEHLAAF